MASPAAADRQQQIVTGNYEMSPSEVATSRARSRGAHENNIVHEVVYQ